MISYDRVRVRERRAFVRVVLLEMIILILSRLTSVDPYEMKILEIAWFETSRGNHVSSFFNKADEWWLRAYERMISLLISMWSRVIDFWTY